MICLHDLTHVFNPGTPDAHRALDTVDLRIEPGEFVTIIGSNGAGKTTLFNLISGRLKPSGGTVEIDGVDMTRSPEFRRAAHIGRIFQDPTLGTAGNMTLEDNLVIASKKGFRGLGISLNTAKRDYFREQLARLDMNLDQRLSDNVEMLSGGQRQAVTLLMTVLSDPKVLLLDEHTAALDPRNAARVLELTDEFIRERGLTALMVTHNMAQAIEYGTRLLMMDAGRIILDVSGEEKKKLTIAGLVDRFHELTAREFNSDEALLTKED